MDPSAPFAGAVDLSQLAKPATPEGAAGTALPDLTEEGFPALVQDSMNRPVFVLLCSPRAPQCAEFGARLGALLAERGDAVAGAQVNVDEQPGIAQAFQVEAVPAVVAIVGGRPAPLFQGAPDDEQVRSVIDQVMEIAGQAGMNGGERPPAAEGDQAGEEPAEEPLSPLQQEAYDAIERGDFDAAIKAYDTALASNPKDAEAKAGRAQVSLLARSGNADLQATRDAAAARPDDVDAQLAVADLDMLGGKVEDAFDRLLDVVRSTAGDERERARTRLVELFEVAGHDDPRVTSARQRLAAALY